MNNVMLVGRLVKTPELFSTENGRKGTFITLAVNRSYKNQNGEYETDYLDCTLWTGIAENTAEYCKKGDTIGVRGKLQSRIIENEDGTKSKRIEVVADRVSFISSKPIDELSKSSEQIGDKSLVSVTGDDIVKVKDNNSDHQDKKKK